MEATPTGRNRTGAAINPGDIKLMLEAVRSHREYLRNVIAAETGLRKNTTEFAAAA